MDGDKNDQSTVKAAVIGGGLVSFIWIQTKGLNNYSKWSDFSYWKSNMSSDPFSHGK